MLEEMPEMPEMPEMSEMPILDTDLKTVVFSWQFILFGTTILGLIVWAFNSNLWKGNSDSLDSKHVRFAEDNYVLGSFSEWKMSTMNYIQNLFGGSRVENGILKSVHSTLDKE